MQTLDNYHGKVKKILKHELEDKKTHKSYITMKIRMSKVDRDGESIEIDAGFNGGTQRLLGEHDIDEFYDDSVNNILEDFQKLNENGSDCIFERVVDMKVNNASI